MSATGTDLAAVAADGADPGAVDRADGACRPEPGRPVLRTVVGLAAWGALVLVAARVGDGFRASARAQAAPLVGRVEAPSLDGRVPWVAVLALLLAVGLPWWCRRLSWRTMLVGLVVVATAWGVALALVRGPEGLDRATASRYDYAAVVQDVEPIGIPTFVRTFSDRDQLATYPTHVQGHPVGVALVFVGLDRLGLGGGRDAAYFLIAAGALIAPGVLVALRQLVGEAAARRAAPFLAVGPASVWLVSSGDALFSVVVAWAVAMFALACAPARSPRAQLWWGAAGGVAFGLAIHLSYGLAPLVLLPVALVVAARRWRVLAVAAVTGGLVTAAFVAGGFWWFDGLAATHERYLAGAAAERSYGYFVLLGNPAAFALALGPVAAIALARVRDRRLWVLAGATLVAVAVANVSGLSKAEVERIWLPWVPWILVLTAGLVGVTATGAAPALAADPAAGSNAATPSAPAARARPGIAVAAVSWVPLLLGLQLATALVIEAYVLTPW